MPSPRVVQNNFTAGFFDAKLHERYDFERYPHGAATLENFVILPHGGITRRLGTRYVATAKNSTATRLMPFVFSATQGVVLEVGNLYVRFFANNGQVTSLGSPYELTTLYPTAYLPGLYTAQSNDILYIDNGSFPPAELRRFGETDWTIRNSQSIPPPTYEAGWTDPGVNHTLSATTGNITITATATVFSEASIGRTFQEDISLGQGVATITSVVSATVVNATVLSSFAQTVYTAGQYVVAGSPVARLRILDNGPVGTKVTAVLLKEDTLNSNLVTNGDLTTNLASWTDLSGGIIFTSTVSAGGGDELLVDNGGTFMDDAVATGHRLINTSSGLEDIVVSVSGQTNLVTTTDGANWGTPTDTYEIHRTGSAQIVSGKAQLWGGARGYGWIEQGVSTTADAFYRLTFDVIGAPLAAMVGSASTLQDLAAESTFTVGNTKEIIFQATGSTSYIGFRNNQNVEAYLDNVVCRAYEVNGWHTTEAGNFIRVNDGLIEITEYESVSRVKGVVRKELSTDDDALEGAWSLESSRWASTYPACVTFHGERLYHAGSADFPQMVWGSQPGQPNNFATGANDADALEFQLAATELNQILWLVGEKNLIAGTRREEFGITGSLGHTLTPSGLDASSTSGIGSKAIQPLKVPGAILFVGRGGRRLYENSTSADSTANDRTVQDRSILAQSLTAAGIRSIAFQQEPDPIVWVVTVDNRLCSMTYLKDQEVHGWAEHPTQGDVLDVCVIPHPDGDRDQVWLLVDRGGDAPYIEYLDDANGYYGQMMVDSGLTATYSPDTSTVSGLDHLAGQTVTVLVDGSQQSDQTVDEFGVITLDTPGSEVEVGLGYTPTVTPLRPALDKQPLSGLALSNARVTVSLLSTLGLTVNDEPLTFSTDADILGQPPALFTGLMPIPLQGWDDAASLTISQPQPYPVTIRAIIRTLEIETP